MNDEILSKLHSVLLNIMLEFKQICDKHDLKYLLGYGTLLGAVRHKGFIPWDDDVDIIMPREDYEKFVDIAEKELPEYLTIHCGHKLKDFPVNITRLYDNRTIYEQEKLQNLSFCKGACIDIFPLDYADKHYFRHLYIIRMFSYIKRRKINFNVPTSTVIKLVTKLVPLKLCNFIIKKETLYHKRPSDFLCQLCTGEYEYEKPVPADLFDKYFLVDFETEKFRAPIDYDSYLKMVYGNDYMSIPPEEKRIQHGAINVSL